MTENFALFSYSDTSFDSPGVDEKSTDLEGRFGWMLTDHHEVGGLLSYFKEDNGVTFDGTAIGPFYQYNFRAGTNMNPYLDFHYVFIGGDAGDVFDDAMGGALGIKVFPWDSGGFNFGVGYDQFNGASGFPDADTTSLFGGILIKWN